MDHRLGLWRFLWPKRRGGPSGQRPHALHPCPACLGPHWLDGPRLVPGPAVDNGQFLETQNDVDVTSPKLLFRAEAHFASTRAVGYHHVG